VSDYFIYHPGSGTMIALSDTVYVIDATSLTELELDESEAGVLDIYRVMDIGVRLDNEYWDEVQDAMEAM